MSVERFFLTPEEKEAIVAAICDKTGQAEWIIRDSNRTDAQFVALARDAPYCVWHKHKLLALRQGHDVHHLLGRLPSQDWPPYCVLLCRDCHSRVEQGRGNPANSELLTLVQMLTRGLPIPYSSWPTP